MFELGKKIKEIEYYFKEIITEFDFKISIRNPNRVELTNDYCIITLTTQRYYCDLQMTFKDTLNNKEYSITEILMKMGLMEKKVFDENEEKNAEKIIDELENGLFAFGIITRKYFHNILKGDFSALQN